MTNTTRLLAMAAAGLLGSMVNPAIMAKSMPGVGAPIMRVSKRQLLRGASGPVIRWGYLKRPPQTVAQNKRAAIKARNRRRNRAACRG